MPFDTFESVWRRAHAEMPAVPPLLCRSWAQTAYDKLCEEWAFSWLRSEGTLVTQAMRTITATVTQGSTAITSAGLFLAADAGRQIRPVVTTTGSGRIPIYTIASVTDASNAVLDRVYTEDSATGSVNIQDIYTVLPPDFRRFLVIYDRYYLRVIPFWLSEDQLAIADPGRVFSDLGPRYVIAQAYSTATATKGQVRYEYWPPPTAFRTYPYLYIRCSEDLNDTDVLPGVLSQRGSALKKYVLALGAGWPGGTDQKNPFYNLQLRQMLMSEWESDKQRLELADDSEYPQQLMTIQWARRLGSIAPTATLLRQTDATINDYY